MISIFQSKLIMFDSWYNQITTIDLKFDLGMTDTDSFLFKVSDAGEFYRRFCSHMDFSNYPIEHPMHSRANKAKLGYFKDELCGKQKCLEFIGLRSKCYSMKLENILSKAIEDKKVCKGVGRVAIKNDMKFEHYKKCLTESIVLRQQFHSIRSTKHELKTVSIRKLALSYVDTKRWIFDCGIHSVPYGSFLIQKYYNKCPTCC